MHYLLFYEVSDDYLARRAEFRDAHLALAWAASERGALVLGGAVADPVDSAVLLFRADSPKVVEDFVKADPYVKNGLVKSWRIRPWTTVAGPGAATPVRPSSGTAVNSSPDKEATILRLWSGRTNPLDADNYVQHVTTKVFPQLRAIAGHRGAYLLRREVDNLIEFVVLTLWDSMAAVRNFAGNNPDQAVVQPAAQAVLESFDETVRHFEILHSSIDCRNFI